LTGITQWLQQLELGSLVDMILIICASLLCITIHETSHGLAALWMGDDTAKRQGRLSLNPLRHVDLMGLAMMALLRFGWAKAVPIDMRRFRKPKLGMALTALAGPVSNVLLAAVAMILRAACYALFLARTSMHWYYSVQFLEYVVILSCGLAVFNLFPVPPLDGSKVFFAVLPNQWYGMLMRYERYGMILLMVLLVTNVLDAPLLFLRGHLLDFMNDLTEPVFLFFMERLI